jgi:site-specific DNA recombinase
LADVKAGNIDVIVVYKVDRLTRSLADFAKLVELFDGHAVSFVSVTQQFNTTTSRGRLTLNVRTIFRSYLELGSLNRLMADLRARGIVTKVRSLKTGRTIGGIPFTRGPLAPSLAQSVLSARSRSRAKSFPASSPPSSIVISLTRCKPSSTSNAPNTRSRAANPKPC